MTAGKAKIGVIVFILCTVLGTASATGQTTKNGSYSPYVGRDYPQNVYFGDTHLHTSISLDAFGDGNTKLGPEEAYRFAKGQELNGHDGKPVRISRPLDFLVVADHAEYLGLVPAIAEGNKELLATEEGARWKKMMDEGKMPEVFGDFILDVTSNTPRLKNDKFTESVWAAIGAAADRHNNPGKFTAFIGYEYSPFPDGDNLHRVVIFRDDTNKTNKVKPFSSFDSQNPEDLWAYLEQYETKTGGKVLAIPHNGNLSGGSMFALQTFEGNPLTKDYAKNRMRWEPLYEVTQIKGDSETHPFVSPKDEFADFESWDKANLAMVKAHKDEFFQYEYARPALKLGLKEEKKLGVNPFKFGMIGSTDSHTSYSNTEEDNYLGKYGIATPSPERWTKIFGEGVQNRVVTKREWTSQQAGLAAVWAEDNTREAIWDAMKRKEVYATTGPRMQVRMFGGFDFSNKDAVNPDLVNIGYTKGVPMGGELEKAPGKKSATFLIAALKDPDGANLDRVQIVKGWLDKKGTVHEKVYDVAVSDGRQIKDGKATKKVGSTVDLKTATYSNSIGEVYLAAAWTDPDFDTKQTSFYYTRVIEIPTPRWTAFDEVRFGIKMAPEVTRILQERAYTSPIWYTP